MEGEAARESRRKSNDTEKGLIYAYRFCVTYSTQIMIEIIIADISLWSAYLYDVGIAGLYLETFNLT